MNRDELLRTASREVASVLVFSDPGTRSQIRNTSDLIAKNILEAIEPLIRADERVRVINDAASVEAVARRAAEVIHADFRAQVMTIPYVLTYGTAEVKRDDVLALLESDAPAVVRCRYCGNVQASISDRAHHEAGQHGAVLNGGSDD